MKLAYWMYAGPAHIGTLRVASSFHNVHALMHAPLGDDYFNVLRSMFERERDFTPVTASIVDRHVLARGSQEKVVENLKRKDKEECPALIVLTPTCTSSILQEDLQNFVNRASSSSDSDIIFADINHYRVNEFQAADKTLEQVIRFYLEKAKKSNILPKPITPFPSVNIIGIFTLGFHVEHDCRELKKLFKDLGIDVNEIIPEGGLVNNLPHLPQAWLNIVPYREVGLMTAQYLEKDYGMPFVDRIPMGVCAIAHFIQIIEIRINEISPILYKSNDIYTHPQTHLSEKIKSLSQFRTSVQVTLNWQSSNQVFSLSYFQYIFPLSPRIDPLTVNYRPYIEKQAIFISKGAWFLRSIDCQNLPGKTAVVFGDATHAAAMTHILARELGINVVCAGTYCVHDAEWFSNQVKYFCQEILITDNHTQVANMIELIDPSAIFGTQMERHIGKRLGIPCGVISPPVHIQNYPLGYRPFLGYEGTHQIADLIYNSITLGMEDHLLEVFGGHDTKEIMNKSLSEDSSLTWDENSETELMKIPGFVRAKVKKRTESYARSNTIAQITLEVMYAAKEAYGR